MKVQVTDTHHQRFWSAGEVKRNIPMKRKKEPHEYSYI